MSQQAAKRRRRQYAIGFSHVAPQQRTYTRRVRNSVAGSGPKGKKT